MNIPAIKNPVERRLHLLWIAPYLAVIFIPFTIIYGLKEVSPEVVRSIKNVWTGR